jgi:hypothetical protein
MEAHDEQGCGEKCRHEALYHEMAQLVQRIKKRIEDMGDMQEVVLYELGAGANADFMRDQELARSMPVFKSMWRLSRGAMSYFEQKFREDRAKFQDDRLEKNVPAFTNFECLLPVCQCPC